jgi:hypothetical protein
MRRFTDLLGSKINRLTVIELLPKRVDSKGRKQVMWRCLCDCGRVTDVHSSSLTQKKAQSCGCLHKELLVSQNKARSVPIRERLITHQFRIYRIGAEKRGLVFELTKEQVASLTFQHCYLCNIAPSNAWKGLSYSGIDRVDNAVGYTAKNSRACCWECNNAKGTMNIERFISMCIRVYSFGAEL